MQKRGAPEEFYARFPLPSGDLFVGAILFGKLLAVPLGLNARHERRTALYRAGDLLGAARDEIRSAAFKKGGLAPFRAG